MDRESSVTDLRKAYPRGRAVRFLRELRKSPLEACRYLLEMVRRILVNCLGRRYFDRTYFDRLYRSDDPWNYLDSGYERRRRQYLLETVRQLPHERVLEAGCGEGVFTEVLAKEAGELVGVDISAIALERAKRRTTGTNVRFVCGDLLKDDLSGTFDLILLTDVLEYVLRDLEGPQKTHALISKLARSLRPGGRLLLGGHLLLQETFRQCAVGGLRVDRELRWDDYQIVILERADSES